MLRTRYIDKLFKPELLLDLYLQNPDESSGSLQNHPITVVKKDRYKIEPLDPGTAAFSTPSD